MPLHLITRLSPRIQKKCCMKCLHRHIVADLRVILVKSGPAKYSFYVDLESDCVIFRYMRLFVQKLKHTRNYVSFRCVDFRNGVYLTKSMQKYYFLYVIATVAWLASLQHIFISLRIIYFCDEYQWRSAVRPYDCRSVHLHWFLFEMAVQPGRRHTVWTNLENTLGLPQILSNTK